MLDLPLVSEPTEHRQTVAVPVTNTPDLLDDHTMDLLEKSLVSWSCAQAGDPLALALLLRVQRVIECLGVHHVLVKAPNGGARLCPWTDMDTVDQAMLSPLAMRFLHLPLLENRAACNALDAFCLNLGVPEYVLLLVCPEGALAFRDSWHSATMTKMASPKPSPAPLDVSQIFTFLNPHPVSIAHERLALSVRWKKADLTGLINTVMTFHDAPSNTTVSWSMPSLPPCEKG